MYKRQVAAIQQQLAGLQKVLQQTTCQINWLTNMAMMQGFAPTRAVTRPQSRCQPVPSSGHAEGCEHGILQLQADVRTDPGEHVLTFGQGGATPSHGGWVHPGRKSEEHRATVVPPRPKNSYPLPPLPASSAATAEAVSTTSARTSATLPVTSTVTSPIRASSVPCLLYTSPSPRD